MADYLTHAEVQLVADAAAQKAVTSTLVSFGLDPSDPIAMQKDMAHLREWRQATDKIRSRGVLAALAFLCLGGIAIVLVSIGFKVPWTH